MNENGQTIFVNFRQGEEELCIASWARRDAQLKGLVELERRCQDTRQEIQVLSERQEIFKSAMEDKLKLRWKGGHIFNPLRRSTTSSSAWQFY